MGLALITKWNSKNHKITLFGIFSIVLWHEKRVSHHDQMHYILLRQKKYGDPIIKIWMFKNKYRPSLYTNTRAYAYEYSDFCTHYHIVNYGFRTRTTAVRVGPREGRRFMGGAGRTYFDFSLEMTPCKINTVRARQQRRSTLPADFIVFISLLSATFCIGTRSMRGQTGTSACTWCYYSL